ncbi:hypothetical protein Cs7R123_00420 [Catellatospora sp. TT07R-123]|nr:hypothetical protein Cs7R123_00420 [Catellatospora sp. TT07R-123]
MPLLVRIRPNLPYLALLALGAALVVFAGRIGGELRPFLFGGGLVLLVLLGYPVVVSTVLRVPVLAVTADGVRLPLMGVRLAWDEIAEVRWDVKSSATRSMPVLLIVPTSPAWVLLRMRPWLRSEGRAHLARYGTPIVLPDVSLDRPLKDVAAAISNGLPRDPS